MTDKANVEIPSHSAGRVLALTGKPGDVIAVGSEIIRLEVEGKGNVVEGAAAAAPTPASKDDVTAGSNSPPPTQASSLPHTRPSSFPPPTTAHEGRLRREPSPEPAPASPNDRPLASPAVRRRARELQV